MTRETVPVLTPGERTPEQLRNRAGMIGTIGVLALLYGAAIGVLLAQIGGVL